MFTSLAMMKVIIGEESVRGRLWIVNALDFDQAVVMSVPPALPPYEQMDSHLVPGFVLRFPR